VLIVTAGVVGSAFWMRSRERQRAREMRLAAEAEG
jgi:hypothetical protein